ncbi:MAG: hypothetical protein JNJ73_16970 [Hyphomonadaceae bacterium]|nr:hypothetical protein [Hyphomonadaceae bacterium]
MADILIRKVPNETKERLKRRAERRGKSLEADLRDALEQLAREDVANPDDSEPFGDWLARLFQPDGFPELEEAIKEVRSAPVRPAKFE